jgi:hypothetical protein
MRHHDSPLEVGDEIDDCSERYRVVKVEQPPSEPDSESVGRGQARQYSEISGAPFLTGTLPHLDQPFEINDLTLRSLQLPSLDLELLGDFGKSG